MVGLAVQLVPAPLLPVAPANVAQDRPRELELMVAAPGEDLLAVLVHHVRHRHPQALGPPCRQQRLLGPGHVAREDGELHAQRVGERVREGHPHNISDRGLVLYCVGRAPSTRGTRSTCCGWALRWSLCTARERARMSAMVPMTQRPKPGAASCTLIPPINRSSPAG